MTQKIAASLISIILSSNLIYEVEATIPAREKTLSQYKPKRAIISFLDPHSLGRLECTCKNFATIVECMDYYKENKKFLKIIQDIEVTLSELESFVKNEEKNQKEIKEHSEKLAELMWNLYPHVQLACEEFKGNRPIPWYNPEFYGNKARDQALAIVMEKEYPRLQQLFVRYKSLKLSSLPDTPVITSNLANRESIIAGIPDELKNDERRDEKGSWIRNPNIAPEEYEELLGFRCKNFYTYWCSIDWVLANPVHPDETIENVFTKFLETAEENAERKKAHLRAATGIALNPVAIKKFGERLLNWMIIHEDSVMIAETSGAFENTDFPLTSLIYNYNLPEVVSKRLVDYLLTRLKQYTVLLIDGYPSEFALASKIEIFCQWLINFAKTAHGSEIILTKLDSILSEPHFGLEFKQRLIEALFEGFNWNYYFKNYSIEHDVKRPFQLPEKSSLAIVRWLSQEVLQHDRLTPILQEVIYRGGLNSEAVHKAIDVLIAHPNKELQADQLLRLIENCNLFENHYRRILGISEIYPHELKTKIMKATGMTQTREKT